jgi:hypothetical protein
MKNWHCYIDSQAYGPYPENLLRELINRRQLTADTFVFNDSPEDASKGWQRAGDTEIAALFLNNSQWTQSIPTIQSGTAYEPGRHQSGEETKSEKPSLMRIFEYFSKKQITGIVGVACVVFILAFTIPAWRGRQSPAPTRPIPAPTPGASTAIAPKPAEVKRNKRRLEN